MLLREFQVSSKSFDLKQRTAKITNMASLCTGHQGFQCNSEISTSTDKLLKIRLFITSMIISSWFRKMTN